MGEDLKYKVRRKYAELAVASQEGSDASCCGASCARAGSSAGVRRHRAGVVWREKA